MLALSRDIYVAVAAVAAADAESIHLPPLRDAMVGSPRSIYNLSRGGSGWLSDEVQFGRAGITTSDLKGMEREI